MKDILILGIETSCDETSAAVVRNGREILSNIISTQIDIHKKYGGVVPEIASRKHVELILPVIDNALSEAGLELHDMDAIGVTYGPGLVGALLVGLCAAKALAYTVGKPLIGVHHIEGHIAANYIEFPGLEPPFICLVVSGGHSHIVHVKNYREFEILGQTRDDAAGEAFDKVARIIGLGYPGGPAIDRAAKNGNKNAINFPRVFFNDSLDFSFSGIKTAVLNYVNTTIQKGNNICVEDVAASFQAAVVDVLVQNAVEAARRSNSDKVVVAGGVAANSFLRAKLNEESQKYGIKVFYPRLGLCTDNAAMVASAAYYEYIEGKFAEMNLNAIPGLRLGER
ncbi:MAG TPA: tRNA (adenosine(37)-N6)-threonylcarbamoyltransferase complex transferase subunit TsaD [Clostridiaceae bacterium]|jgi:N6-L-threonylcarbamoyladenine synthase|nr:tRNA (adenosine(37)-N6)-threonylcarbamoyltransferase complex transferase subunit TsaD [Clostridiaceae bacterium]